MVSSDVPKSNSHLTQNLTQGATMSSLRYLCLSDLHLGAAYSMLTHIDDQGAVQPDVPSLTLQALAAGLRDTAAQLTAAGAPAPTLVLMGDALDLGLSPLGQVSHAFLRFVDVMFPAGAPLLFAPRIIFMPGNHDHHLWRVAQDDAYLNSLPSLSTAVPDPEAGIGHDIEQALPLFDPPMVPCGLLTRLLRMRAHLAQCRVDIAYPNFGFTNADGSRAVVLHHGHYVDAMYRAMSRINAWLAGSTNPPPTVDKIERQNGAWVDFLWSNLGSSGKIGKDALTMYETLLDAGASHSLANKLSERILKQLGATYGVRAETQIYKQVTVGGAVRAAVDLVAGNAADSQRDGYREILSNDEINDLRWYIGGPVAEQMRSEGKLGALRELSFVFGHTHKPFQDQLAIAPYPAPVAIYNTGGWVMDQPTLMARQGGAAMFIDEAMNVASLRLFNDPVNGDMPAVHAAGVGGFRDAQNPLLAALTRSVAHNASAWDEFTRAAQAAMEKRAHQVLDRLFHPDVANIENHGSVA
jgi:Calcineurin-like phosphoesterase